VRYTRVVIVDDEIPMLESLRLFPWQAHGFELAGEARNGREALELCRQTAPAIVVTDIVMPGMDGIRLTYALKEWNPNLQVILLTCHSDFDYIRQALVSGASDYLLKGTYSEEDLLDTLNKTRSKINKTMPAEPDVRYEISCAIRLIHERMHEPLSLTEIAQEVSLSANHFGILFRKETGEYFQDYVKKVRMDKAAELLRNSTLKVYEIAQSVGIPNYRYFTDVFCKHFHKTPREYRGI